MGLLCCWIRVYEYIWHLDGTHMDIQPIGRKSIYYLRNAETMSTSMHAYWSKGHMHMCISTATTYGCSVTKNAISNMANRVAGYVKGRFARATERIFSSCSVLYMMFLFTRSHQVSSTPLLINCVVCWHFIGNEWNDVSDIDKRSTCLQAVIIRISSRCL